MIHRLHENVELHDVQPVLNLVVLRRHFTNILTERSAADGTLKIHKDAAFTENPMEREDIEESVKVIILAGLELRGINFFEIFLQIIFHGW